MMKDKEIQHGDLQDIHPPQSARCCYGGRAETGLCELQTSALISNEFDEASFQRHAVNLDYTRRLRRENQILNTIIAREQSRRATMERGCVVLDQPQHPGSLVEKAPHPSSKRARLLAEFNGSPVSLLELKGRPGVREHFNNTEIENITVTLKDSGYLRRVSRGCYERVHAAALCFLLSAFCFAVGRESARAATKLRSPRDATTEKSMRQVSRANINPALAAAALPITHSVNATWTGTAPRTRFFWGINGVFTNYVDGAVSPRAITNLSASVEYIIGLQSGSANWRDTSFIETLRFTVPVPVSALTFVNLKLSSAATLTSPRTVIYSLSLTNPAAAQELYFLETWKGTPP